MRVALIFGIAIILIIGLAIKQNADNGDQSPVFKFNGSNSEELRETILFVQSHLDSNNSHWLNELVSEVNSGLPGKELRFHSNVLDFLQGRSFDEVYCLRDTIINIHKEADLVEYRNLNKKRKLREDYFKHRDSIKFITNVREIERHGRNQDNTVEIDVTIVNNSKFSLSEVGGKMSVTCLHYGRQKPVPVMAEGFWAEFDTVLIPGEKFKTKTWAAVSAYYTRRFNFNDGECSIVATRAWDANGNLVFSRNSGLSSDERERLKFLEIRYGNNIVD